MQISAAKSSTALSGSTPSLSVVGRIRQLLAPARDIPFVTSGSGSVEVDSATVQSLYRSARLLTANDRSAADLVAEAYRNIASRRGSSSRNCAGLRIELFAALYSAFLQDSGKYRAAETPITVLSNNADRAKSLRDLILQQEPAVRAMIFLRHCENFSLEQVAWITREVPSTVLSQLLQFRHSLHELFRNAEAQAKLSDLEAC